MTFNMTTIECVARLRSEVLPELRERAAAARGIDAFEAGRDVVALLAVLNAADAFSTAVGHITAHERVYGAAASGFLGGMRQGLQTVTEADVAAYIAEVSHA